MESTKEKLERELEGVYQRIFECDNKIIHLKQLYLSPDTRSAERWEIEKNLLQLESEKLALEHAVFRKQLVMKEEDITLAKQRGDISLQEALYYRATINRDRDVGRIENEIAAIKLDIALTEMKLKDAESIGDIEEARRLGEEIRFNQENIEELTVELEETKQEHERLVENRKREMDKKKENHVNTQSIEDGERRTTNIAGQNYYCDITQQEEGKNYVYGVDGKAVQEVYIEEGHQDWKFIVPSESSQFSDTTVSRQVTELKNGGHITIDSVQYGYMNEGEKFNTIQRASDRLADKGYMEYESININESTGERVSQTYREFEGGKRTFSRKSNDGIIAVTQDSNGTVINVCDKEGNVQDIIRYDSKGKPMDTRKGFSFNERGELVANPKKTFKGIERMPENMFESPEVMEVFGGRSTEDGEIPDLDTQQYYEQFKNAYPNLNAAQEKLNKSGHHKPHGPYKGENKDKFEH